MMDGPEVRRLRKLTGLNREQLATRASIHSSTLGRIERDEQHVIYVDTATLIVKALNAALEAAGRKERVTVEALTLLSVPVEGVA